MNESFFRRIENTKETRRKVLEASKDIIQNLKSYQNITDIREKKLYQIKILKAEFKEINLMMNKLRDLFPAELVAKFEEEKTKKQEKTNKSNAKKGKSKKTAKKPVKNIPEPSELTKLENKLSDIESKLKTLG